MNKRKLGLFYNKNCLQNVLMGIIDDSSHFRKVCVNSHVVFVDDRGYVIGFNILQADSLIDNLVEGFLYPGDELLAKIEKILSINLKPYYQQRAFLIGEVVDFEGIEGTHLRKCKINVGESEFLNIVCGANNFCRNDGVVVAVEGCVMPNGQIVKKQKVYGEIYSEGMMCSYRELNLPHLPEEEKGIICLPLDCHENKVGNEFFRVYAHY